MVSYRPFWELIKERGMTTYELMKHYKISTCTLQRMRDNENLSTKTLDKICRMLKVPIDSVMEIVEK